MVVKKRRLLTPEEEGVISQFVRDRVRESELKEMYLKYKPKLTYCLNQQIENTPKTWGTSVDCPIEKFLEILKDLYEDEKLPMTKEKRNLDFYKYKMSQFFSLEDAEIRNEFLCGFSCPSCPAPIVSESS